MGVKKVFLSWDDVNRLLDTIHAKTKGEIDYVTGIPRGGTILAIMYSHRFDVPYFEYKSNHYPRLLIIDDIADSGDKSSLKQLNSIKSYLVGEEKLILEEYFHSYFAGFTEELRRDLFL